MTANNGHHPASDAQSLSFEDAFRQLAEIAEGMEKGGLTLAEATARFEITQLRESYQRPVASAGYTNDSEPPFDYQADNDESYEDEDSLPF